jgi:hypothetical protein
MTPEEEITNWIRIYAVEILAVNLCALSLLQTSEPEQIASGVRQQMIDGARTHGFSGLDPAQSDLASAELEDAVGRLMEMVSAQINVVLEARRKGVTGP